MTRDLTPRALRKNFDLLEDEQWCRRAAGHVLEMLVSEAGQQLLASQLAFAAGPRDVRIRGWAVDLKADGEGLASEYREQIDRMLQALFPDIGPKDGDEVDPRVLAEKLLAGIGALVEKRSVLAQIVEVLDDAEVIKQVAKDGSIAAIIGLVLSARAQSKAYAQGRIRWDDALDNVALDVVKVGLTGVIVSAVITASGLTGGAGVAAAVPLAIVVHATVSAFCDATYEHVLGGKLIREARRRHGAYGEVARYIRNHLYADLERANAVGLLLELARELDADPTQREELAGEAVALLSSARGRSLVLTRGDERRTAELHATLLWYLEHKGIETPLLTEGEDGKRTLDVAEFEQRCLKVHSAYWERKELQPSVKVVADNLLGDLGWTPKHLELVKHLVDLEHKRPSREACLMFRYKCLLAGGKFKRVPPHLFASNLVEAIRFVALAEHEDWGTGREKPAMELKRLGVVKHVPATFRDDGDLGAALDLVRELYTRWDVPMSHEIANGTYRKGFAQELAQGQWRLFSIDVSRDSRPHYRYVAIPSARGRRHAAAHDKEILLRSLKTDHPYFRDLGMDHHRSIREIDVVDHLRSKGGPFAAMGFRCVPLELYTATFLFQDRDGSTRYISQEGYFNSLHEAQVAFATKLDKHDMVGVRPGGLVFSEDLRQRLQDATETDFWSLQRELIAHLSTGMIQLDMLANNAEGRNQALAGTGVVVSAWWFVSQHTRRELVGALEDAQVQQALRFELMESLIALNRLHALNRHKGVEDDRDRHLKALEVRYQTERRLLASGQRTTG